MEKEADVVCFSDICWDFVWQRHQNLLTRFPKEWKILFIEPTSLVVLMKEPKRLFARKCGNITIVSRPVLPLTDKVSFLRPINDHLMLCWLRITFKLKKISRPVLLYYEPRFSSLIGKLGERLVVYDYVDDRMAFPGVPGWMRYYVEGLIKKAHVVFVTSENLRIKILEHRKDGVYLIGNGVDADLFHKALEDVPVPKDVSGIKKPAICYFGVIDDWLDADLVAEAAAEYPEASIVILGPLLISAEGLKKLKSRSNILLLGEKPHDDLPYYLKAFDVCIIPFKVNELTRSVNPVKLYEYLAGGKNVVTTEMPELEKYKDAIYIARGHRDFVQKIGLAMAGKPDIDRCLSIVNDNTWDKKAKDMVMVITSLL